MGPKIGQTMLRLTAYGLVALTVTGCNVLTRLSEVGDGPELTKIVNPVARPDYRPVSLPMPTPQVAEDNPNSLWRAGAKAFFKDHRAKEIGDVLTVKLDFTDTATFENKTLTTLAHSQWRLGTNRCIWFDVVCSNGQLSFRAINVYFNTLWLGSSIISHKHMLPFPNLYLGPGGNDLNCINWPFLNEVYRKLAFVLH